MNPLEFKTIWMKNDSERWVEFPVEQVERSNLNKNTKEFLKVGFPEDAAPFLGFGSRSYDWEFSNVFDYFSDYKLDIKTKYYWLIGSDNNGNSICIDSSKNDSIIILDHEQDFQVIEMMNKNISELAASLVLYRIFIKKVNSELGEDAFLNYKFSEKHLTELENEFQKLNPNFSIESSFWHSEINSLRCQIN